MALPTVVSLSNNSLNERSLPNLSNVHVASLDRVDMAPLVPLTFLVYTLGSQLRVHWGRLVADTPLVRQPARYAIAGPSVVQVTGVAYAETHAILTYSGVLLPGQTYTLTVAAETVKAQGDGALNVAASSSFLGDDDTPPVVSYTPAPGTPVDPSGAILAEVYDRSGLRRVLVTVDFPELGTSEVVHDGTDFKPQYKPLSTLEVPEAGRLRYRIRRVGGWPSGSVFHVYAADVAGNEV